MKKYHRFIAVVCLIALFFTILCVHFNAATIYKSDGYLYAITSSAKAEIHGRETEDANVVIPKDFNDYYVTEIVDSAFSGDNNIISLSFSKAVLLDRIGYYAFANCHNLSGTVYLTGKITNVGISAFQDCSSLEGIAFRAPNITTIYAQTCYNCTSLSYIELPERLQVIEKYAFANTTLKEITIPKSVTSIDTTAFDGCNDLTIYCYTDSYAQQYAVDNDIPFILLDAPAPTEPPTEPEPTEAPTEAPTDEPTIPATEVPTEASVKYLGDVDGDGTVTSIDATLIQRHLCYIKTMISDEMIMMGDVDDDGIISIIDVSYMMRYLATIEVPYPIGKPISNN